jgi:hypothetical protein
VKSPARYRMLPPENDRELGAYAVLYAVLVVVLVGMAAIVVDVAGLRQDRRDNRAAADSASVAGAEFLNSIKGGIQPKKACERAWNYLSHSLDGVSTPPSPCSEFNSVTPSTYCVAGAAMIRAERVIGDRKIVIAWPIPKDDPATPVDESQGFLQPDVAPAQSVTQVFAPDRDGSAIGCDRLGVAVLQNRSFGLAAGIGMSEQRTSIHSVARFDPKGGHEDQIAALNVLNLTDCSVLVTTGSGKVLVGPTVDNVGNVIGPGIIAVDSDGSSRSCVGTPNADGTGGGDRVVDPNRSLAGSLVCAANSQIPTSGALAGSCDGLGQIQSYAYYLGNFARAFNPDAVPTNLNPSPIERTYQERWFPVTSLFGCTSALSPCVPPADPEPNYIKKLVEALGGSGIPSSNYTSSQPPYRDPLPPGFTNTNVSYPGVCGGSISTTIWLPAGNWYAPCSINIATGGALIIQGGTLVVEGGLSTAGGSGRGGCFVMNVQTTTCPSGADIVDRGTKTATTSPAPTRDAIIYLRGNGCSCGLNHAGTLVMPQTFMYAAPNARELKVTSPNDFDSSNLNGKFTLWTAPVAGAIVDVATQRGTLEQQCYISATNNVDDKCLRSRFSKLIYWSSYAAPKNPNPNTFNGQGALNVVGVFFTPTAYFNFTGGGDYTASFAQFWADKLNVDGGARLILSPDVKTAITTPSGAINLIR